MTRPQLRLAAVVLVVAIVVVAANALDRLPSSLRTQIDGERTALTTSQSQFGALRTQVNDQVTAAPDLFSALPFGQQLPDRMSQASGELRTAADDVDKLTRLEKHNRRSDRQQVDTLLAEEKKNRAQALTDAAAIEKEAAHWADAASHLPQQIPEMDERQNTSDSFEFDGKVWLYRLSREVRASRSDQAIPTGFYYWEFLEQAGKGMIGIRKAEGEPFAVNEYLGIAPSDVTIYRSH